MNHLNRILKITLNVFVCTILLSACALTKINKQKKITEIEATINGTIIKPKDYKGNIIVQLYKLEEDTLRLRTSRIVSHNGNFSIMVVPDSYILLAFADSNDDMKYQRSELATTYHAGEELPLTKEMETKLDIDTLYINSQLVSENAPNIKIENSLPIWDNIGDVVKLSDTRFACEHYKTGMWRPLDFLQTAEGGLFLLEEYDPTKLPILIVHGSGGGPLHWEPLINGLDKERYQPMLLYYPTGIRLNIISDFMVETINQIKTQYNINKFAILAHSMGGLVTRSFLKKYIKFHPENISDIKMVATISSPMAGLESAASGVKSSPIVVPAWRDLCPESNFICDLQAWNWPKEIPYHLIVSYEKNKSNDGVVELKSQAYKKLQAESTRMYLFNNNHADILSNPELITLLNNVLKSSVN